MTEKTRLTGLLLRQVGLSALDAAEAPQTRVFAEALLAAMDAPPAAVASLAAGEGEDDPWRRRALEAEALKALGAPDAASEAASLVILGQLMAAPPGLEGWFGTLQILQRWLAPGAQTGRDGPLARWWDLEAELRNWFAEEDGEAAPARKLARFLREEVETLTPRCRPWIDWAGRLAA